MKTRLGGLVVGVGLLLVRGATAQPGATAATRFEQNAPSVTLTGGWSTNSLPANSGGSAVLSMEAGAQATFAFAGTSVSWIGYRDEWCGLADVFLDGALQTTVDTYAAPARAQAILYSASGLRDGRHTLTIQAKGAHSSASSGSWIWVDAFLVAEPSSSPPPRADSSRMGPITASEDPSTPSSRNRGGARAHGEVERLVEQEDPSATWTGSWSTNHLPAHSGHSARLSMEPSSRVDFSFTGTGVRWLGYRDEWSGIAEVYLDGRLRATVDTYAKPARPQVEIYAIDGLRDGPHTLTIQPTGRHATASGGAWIWVDAFSILRGAPNKEREE